MLTGRSAIANLKDKEGIRQYRMQYPDAISFQNPDTKASLEYMLLEFKLEKQIEQCNGIVEQQKKSWLESVDRALENEKEKVWTTQHTLTFQAPKNFIIPSQLQPISLLEYRKERKNILDAMATIPAPPPARIQADILREEVKIIHSLFKQLGRKCQSQRI